MAVKIGGTVDLEVQGKILTMYVDSEDRLVLEIRSAQPDGKRLPPLATFKCSIAQFRAAFRGLRSDGGDDGPG